MTELTDLNDTDALNTAVSGNSTEGNVANMGNMDNLQQAILGMLSRFRNANIFRLRDNTDKTKLLAFDLSGLTTATTRTWTAPDKNGTVALSGDASTFSNLGLAASVASNALTISLKGADGNDPSAGNVVTVPFRSATANSGDIDVLSVTAATSLVISSGSTMGFTSATAGRLWIVGFNDGGTFRLGAVNVLSGTSIMALRDGIYSSTAEGGAGGADSAQVIYTSTAVTSKALTILGYMDWSAGLTTAGTWAIVPTNIQLLGPGIAKPGEAVQVVRIDTGAYASGSTAVPQDNSIPQITEGDQYMSLSVTPKGAGNILDVTANGIYASGVDAVIAQSIFQDAISNALATTASYAGAANRYYSPNTNVKVRSTTSMTTFRTRAGQGAGGTVNFNGFSGSQQYGGALNSYMQISEIMA